MGYRDISSEPVVSQMYNLWIAELRFQYRLAFDFPLPALHGICDPSATPGKKAQAQAESGRNSVTKTPVGRAEKYTCIRLV